MGAFLITGVEFVSKNDFILKDFTTIGKKKKKKKKPSAYTKNRNRIMQQIRRLEKRTGQKISLSIPTEKQLRSQGITGHKLASATAGLKAMKSKDLESAYGGYTKKFDPMTGEIFDNESAFEPPFQPTDDSLLDRETLEYFEFFLNSMPEVANKNILRRWRDAIVGEFGTQAFAEMFRKANEKRPIANESEIFSSKSTMAVNWINTAMYFLPDSGPITRDEYEEKLQNILAEMHAYDAQGYWETVE